MVWSPERDLFLEMKLDYLFLLFVVIAVCAQMLCQSPQFAFSSRFWYTQIPVYKLYIEVFRTGDMALKSAKFLLHKHQEALRSVSSTHVQRPGMAMCIVPVLGRHRQADPEDLLASWCRRISELDAQWETKRKQWCPKYCSIYKLFTIANILVY